MAEQVGAFFTVGGTLRSDAPSYVERAADRDLLLALMDGQFCYVLDSRQKGKSSLMSRAIARLQVAGVKCAKLDLQRFGTNLDVERWYAGLLNALGEDLGLNEELFAYWSANQTFGPLTRWVGAIEHVVLHKLGTGRLCIFVDEIDFVRSLPFATDEFFVGIRELFNRRSSDPKFTQIAFCLLGVATPSDLIQDDRITPFNVGKRIELTDFTLDEALQLAPGLADMDGKALITRVHHWTNGHPYLTQALCAELGPGATAGDVDRIVEERYLDARVRQSDSNLADVGNRILGPGGPDSGGKDRADALSLFGKMLKGGIEDDESNACCSRIKMSGVAKWEAGHLSVRNEIYRKVFDKAWIRENMPGQEVRRQKRAFRLGVLRTVAISAVVVSIIGFLAWKNASLARQFKAQRDQAEYDTYVASMRMIPIAWRAGDLASINRTLDATKSNPARGWEWKFWHRLANRATVVVPIGNADALTSADDSGLRLAVGTQDSVTVYDLTTAKVLHAFHMESPHPGIWQPIWLHDGHHIIARRPDGYELVRLNTEGWKVERKRGFKALVVNVWSPVSPVGPSDRSVLIGRDRLFGAAMERLDPVTLESFQVPPDHKYGLLNGMFSGDGKLAAWAGSDGKDSWVTVRSTTTWKELGYYTFKGSVSVDALSPNGQDLIMGFSNGELLDVDPLRGTLHWRRSLGDRVLNLSFDQSGRRLLISYGGNHATLFKLRASGIDRIQDFPGVRRAWLLGTGGKIGLFKTDFSILDISQLPDIPEREEPFTDFGSWTDSHILRDGRWINTNVNVENEISLLDRTPRLRQTKLAAPPGLFDSEGEGWFSYDGNGKAAFFDRKSGKKVLSAIPTDVTGSVLNIRSPDLRYLAMNERIGCVTLHDLHSGKVCATISGLGEPAAGAFSADGRLFAVGDSVGSVVTIRTADWHEVSRTKLLAGYVFGIAFAPDDRRLVAVGTDEVGRTLNLASNTAEFKLAGHFDYVSSVDWSPDGTRIATGSGDKTVRLWDAATGRELGIIGTHDHIVIAVRWLSGGRILASADSGGVAKLWMTDDSLEK